MPRPPVKRLQMNAKRRLSKKPMARPTMVMSSDMKKPYGEKDIRRMKKISSVTKEGRTKNPTIRLYTRLITPTSKTAEIKLPKLST